MKMTAHFGLLVALLAGTLGLCCGAGAKTQDSPPAGIDARMMRYPDVLATQIAFVYAGDIWVAPKQGGTVKGNANTFRSH